MSQGDLKFSDWPMFDRVMRDPDVCRRFLQVVLGIEVGRLDYVDVEKSLFPDIEAKSVRLDVFAKDSSHVFDVEMQSLPERRLGRRLRYYQAAMDVTSMPTGVAYDGLPESYIIFLCGHESVWEGRSCLHIQDELPGRLVDGPEMWFCVDSCLMRKRGGVAKTQPWSSSC